MGSQLSDRSSFRLSFRSSPIQFNKLHCTLGNTAISAGDLLYVKQSVPTRYKPSRLRLSHLGLDRRDLAILVSVADCRLITTGHLQRLHFTNYLSLNHCRRACQQTLRRLARNGMLKRSKRRIGGVIPGSETYVYTLGYSGAKLLSCADKQIHPYSIDPTDYFFGHTIGLTEFYTTLHELADGGDFFIMDIQTEPYCWRQYDNAGAQLMPDMYVEVAGNSGTAYSWFVEWDRGTEHTPQLINKLMRYERYFATGVEQQTRGVFPQVLWIVPNNERKAVLENTIQKIRGNTQGLFIVRAKHLAIPYFLSEVT